jgi:hypothetical protein
MRFDSWRCPECGETAKGQWDTVPGLALLTFDTDNNCEWAGETEMRWDGQVPDIDAEGRVLLECPNGHQWRASQCNAEQAEDKAERGRER